jgi:hypothetical protein
MQKKYEFYKLEVSLLFKVIKIFQKKILINNCIKKLKNIL